MSKRCIQCGFPMVEGHKCPTQGQGMRHNAGKSRTDLIPPIVLLELGKHYEYGARKYLPNNWLTGFPYSDTYASLTRHLYAWWAGERTDPESGAHHLVAVLWNVVALFYFELFPEKYGEFDDRAITERRKSSIAPRSEMKSVPYDDGHVQELTWTEPKLVIHDRPVPIPEGFRLLSDGEPLVPKRDLWLDIEAGEWKLVDPTSAGTPFDSNVGYPVIRRLSATEKREYMTPAPIPEGFAMLRNGDILMEGDMYLSSSNRWANILHEDIGMKYDSDRMGVCVIRKYHPADATSERIWAIIPENQRRLNAVIDETFKNVPTKTLEKIRQAMYNAMYETERKERTRNE